MNMRVGARAVVDIRNSVRDHEDHGVLSFARGRSRVAVDSGLKAAAGRDEDIEALTELIPAN